jgi:hypothetical protein
VLSAHRQELERQGYRIVAGLPDGFVASRSKWYWECMVTKISTMVLVRQVDEVTAPMILADRAALAQNATQYDPSALPRGFQKGRALATFYVAGRATPEAIALATARPPLEFASFSLVGIAEGGRVHYYRDTPFVGGIYFAKFRYLLGRLGEPGAAPDAEPLSALGLMLTAIFGCGVLLPVCCLPISCVVSGLLSQ